MLGNESESARFQAVYVPRARVTTQMLCVLQSRVARAFVKLVTLEPTRVGCCLRRLYLQAPAFSWNCRLWLPQWWRLWRLTIVILHLSHPYLLNNFKYNVYSKIKVAIVACSMKKMTNSVVCSLPSFFYTIKWCKWSNLFHPPTVCNYCDVASCVADTPVPWLIILHYDHDRLLDTKIGFNT